MFSVLRIHKIPFEFLHQTRKLCVPFITHWKAELLFHTSNTYYEETVEAQPVRKYKKPVDWLPFPWHRRPRFNVFEKSGDLVKTMDMDPSLPKPDFELSGELKTASEEVRKVFTAETASQSERREMYRRYLVKKVQRHPHDFDSLEVRIALKTAQVRALFEHAVKLKKEIRGSRIALSILIQKRNSLLCDLRKIDTDRFLWILKELQLEYTPPPLQVPREKYCKKWDLRRLTKEYCEKKIREKKAAYHQELKKQQEDFLKEKAEILAWIEKEEKELNNFS